MSDIFLWSECKRCPNVLQNGCLVNIVPFSFCNHNSLVDVIFVPIWVNAKRFLKELFSLSVISGGQPPYVASKKNWESRTLDHGQPTTMKCPVQGDGRQPVYFRWFKVGPILVSLIAHLCLSYTRARRRCLKLTLVTSYLGLKIRNWQLERFLQRQREAIGAGGSMVLGLR